MKHLNAEGNGEGDAAAAPFFLAGGGLGQRLDWGGELGRRRAGVANSVDSSSGWRAWTAAAPARDDDGGMGSRAAVPGAGLQQRSWRRPAAEPSWDGRRRSGRRSAGGRRRVLAWAAVPVGMGDGGGRRRARRPRSRACEAAEATSTRALSFSSDGKRGSIYGGFFFFFFFCFFYFQFPRHIYSASRLGAKIPFHSRATRIHPFPKKYLKPRDVEYNRTHFHRHLNSWPD